MRFRETVCFVASMAILGVGCGSAGATRDKESKTIAESEKDASFTPAQRPISGAIWTTDPTGERVNANIYDAKADVHLMGGPARPGVAGLPDGNYYYIITDPGCKELLAGPFPETSDPEVNGIPNTADKQIVVVDGETDPVLTQLAPFNDTPNNGGEYKVHVTQVDDYDPDAKNSCFGFVPNLSKTDNFKVRQPGTFCIFGEKFYDVYYDGERDPEDTTGVAGFKIILTYPDDSTAFTYTDAGGDYAFCNLTDGEYDVNEELPPVVNGVTWLQMFPASGGYTVTIDGADATGADFGNSCKINTRWSLAPCAVPEY
jgi:hypothetical protein